MIKNIILVVLLFSSLTVQAGNRSSVDSSKVIVPKNNRFLEWNSKEITVVSRKNDLLVHLKGRVLAEKVESFAYQVAEGDAQKINIRKKEFELDVAILSVPSVIRFWLERKEGKGVKLDSYEVKIEESELVNTKEKLINY